MSPFTYIFREPNNRETFIQWVKFILCCIFALTLFLVNISLNRRIESIDDRLSTVEESNHLLHDQVSIVLGKIPIKTDEGEGTLEVIRIPNTDEELDSENT